MQPWKRLRSFVGRFFGKRNQSDSHHNQPQNWNQKWKSGKPKHWEMNAVSRYFVAAFEDGLLKPGDRCLDIGCGAGHSSAWFAEKGLLVLGVDLAATAIEQAKTAYPARERLEFRQADATQAHPDLGEFDVILDRGCLHVIPPAKSAGYLRNIAVWLKPSGVFLLQFATKRRTPEQSRETLREHLPTNFKIVQETAIDLLEGKRQTPLPGFLFVIRREIDSPPESRSGVPEIV